MEQETKPTYWYLQTIKEIYNNLNYNSTQYINYNSLIPHFDILKF